MDIVASFEIGYTRYIDPSGHPVQPLPGFGKEPAALIALYRAITLARRFDAKMVALQRTGRLGTVCSALGQEAVAVGLASAMKPEDVLVPSYREAGAQLWRGVKLLELLLYWGGDERGSDFTGPRHDFPISIPVASHTLHAVGAAYAMRLRREPRVAVCVLGDGGSSKGDFYEAINFAGVWQVPVVFVVVNNEWAISVPRGSQTGTETLAQKAIAAGFPGEQVDGNDVIAMRHVVSNAVERARSGNGPGLIEALTYRLSDHTTSDDASRYRDSEMVREKWRADPISRLRIFLNDSGVWNKDDELRLINEVDAEIEAAVQLFEATSAQPPVSMLDHLYAELPAALVGQRSEVAAHLGGNDVPDA